MTDDDQTAMVACEEWSNGEPAVTTQEEELSFKEGFKRGLKYERKKWQKFKWRNSLEKPEPDSYIIAAEDLGNGEYEYMVGTYIADSEPWISNGQNCRMWHCIDRWCYAEDMNRTLPKVQR